jgi:hypothetical protein
MNATTFSVEMNADDYADEPNLTDHEIAQRLSQAIVKTVEAYRAEGCSLVSMEFNNGLVVLQFSEGA